MWGRISGVLAGLPPNRVIVTSEVRPLAVAADVVLDFTIPAATVKLAALAAETKLAHIIGTTEPRQPMTRRSRRPPRRPRS
jgi:4-hydroxy-tetrahydrodipicolinate reductase